MTCPVSTTGRCTRGCATAICHEAIDGCDPWPGSLESRLPPMPAGWTVVPRDGGWLFDLTRPGEMLRGITAGQVWGIVREFGPRPWPASTLARPERQAEEDARNLHRARLLHDLSIPGPFDGVPVPSVRMPHDNLLDEMMFTWFTGKAPTGLAAADYFTSPRGSMGEEAACCAIDHGPGVDCTTAEAFAGIQWTREEVDLMCGLGALFGGLHELAKLPPEQVLGALVPTTHYGPDDEDRAMIERINRSRPAPLRVRLTPFGAEPWDLAAGEAA